IMYDSIMQTKIFEEITRKPIAFGHKFVRDNNSSDLTTVIYEGDDMFPVKTVIASDEYDVLNGGQF
ncbi:22537_t:CDS:1, partial [Racocetra persica]